MATLKELAQAAGVSIRTVARTLQNTGPVSAETRLKVERAAMNLGYRANLAARSVRQQRNGTVALLVSEDESHSSMSRGLLEGIEKGLDESRFRFCLRFLQDRDLSDPLRLRRMVSDLGADGLLIHYPHVLPPEAEAVLNHFHLPTVWTNRNLRDNAVFPDDHGAAKAAVRDFAARGLSQIAYVHFLSADRLASVHFSAAERDQGYQDAMAELSLKPRVIRPAKNPPPGWMDGAGFMRELFQNSPRPEAIIAYSEVEASSILLAGTGGSRPLPVLAFTPRETAWALPGVERRIIPERTVGREAARLLLAKMETPAVPLPSLRIPYGESA